MDQPIQPWPPGSGDAAGVVVTSAGTTDVVLPAEAVAGSTATKQAPTMIAMATAKRDTGDLNMIRPPDVDRHPVFGAYQEDSVVQSYTEDVSRRAIGVETRYGESSRNSGREIASANRCGDIMRGAGSTRCGRDRARRHDPASGRLPGVRARSASATMSGPSSRPMTAVSGVAQWSTSSTR